MISGGLNFFLGYYHLSFSGSQQELVLKGKFPARGYFRLLMGFHGLLAVGLAILTFKGALINVIITTGAYGIGALAAFSSIFVLPTSSKGLAALLVAETIAVTVSWYALFYAGYLSRYLELLTFLGYGVDVYYVLAYVGGNLCLILIQLLANQTQPLCSNSRISL